MTTNAAVVEAAIRSALAVHQVGAVRLSHSALQPTIAQTLRSHGMLTVEEDGSLVPVGSALWRDWNDPTVVESARGRRRIDITVRQGNAVVAMIEVEHDLADLPLMSGMKRSNRNGTYAVRSIARSADGSFFESYKSLERMAVALHSLVGGTSELSTVCSDAAADHNALGISVFLVTERCRPSDERILAPRLRSLGGLLLSRM